MPHILTFSYEASTVFSSISILLLPVMIVVFISLEMNWRAKERQAMNAREEERQSYIAQIFKTQETERKRLAQELHDGIIQTLLVIASRIHKFGRSHIKYDNKNALDELNWLENTSLTISEELRHICINLRPSILDDLGLVSALRWLTECLHTETGIKIKYVVKVSPPYRSGDLDANIFRSFRRRNSNI
jgi:signal transduction histidine kinase